MRKGFWKKIVGAGLMVGCLDMAAAFIHFYVATGKDPFIVPRYIASAAFGAGAYSSGQGMIAWGFLFHFIIALGWTILFFFAYRRLRWMSRNLVLTGILYGLFVWLMMTQLVLPLTKIKTQPFELKQAMISILILIGALGLPLTFMARSFFRGFNS